MIDLDYKNENNDYILDMFFGIEDEELYIGIKYKDGSISKYPLTIHNYNVLTASLERQYNEYIDSFSLHKEKELVAELIKLLFDLLCFIAINGFFLYCTKNMLFSCCFIIVSGITLLIVEAKKENKILASTKKEKNNVLAINKYLKNKENFRIEMPNGESFYGVNIANINGGDIDYMENDEIKSQIEVLRLSYEKDNKDINE